MTNTPYLVSHFMVNGAEHCLNDYHFIRNTIDTVQGQEEQLNRILRMLDQDEISLNWHVDTSAIRSRLNSRSYDFNRSCLPGNIAYLRLREKEQEDLKRRSLSTYSNRRPILERRRRISELGNDFHMSKYTSPQYLRERSIDSVLSNSTTRKRIDDEQNTDSFMSRSATTRQRIREQDNDSLLSNSATRQRTKEQGIDSLLSNSITQKSKAEHDNDALLSKYTARQQTSAQDKDTASLNSAKQKQINEQNTDSLKPKSATRKQKDEQGIDPLSSDLAASQSVTKQVDDALLSSSATQKQVKKQGTDTSLSKSTTQQQKDEQDIDSLSASSVTQKQTKKQETDSSLSKSTSQEQKAEQASDTSLLNSTTQKQTKKQEKDSSLSKSATQQEKDGQNTDPLLSNSVTQQQASLKDEANKQIEEKSSKEKPVVNDEKQKQTEKDTEVKNQKRKTSNVKAEESKQADDNDENLKSQLNNSVSFAAHYEESSASNKNPDNQDSLGYIVCEWTTPKSSSSPAAAVVNYYTVERQLGDQEWLPIGEPIDKVQNNIELGLSSLLGDQTNENIPSSFRLKAHLKNEKTWTSKPTDKINVDALANGRFIKPDVEILSPNSVQLTWKPTGDEKVTKYDIEKKENKKEQWIKVSKVPLLQGVAQLDDIINAQQCEFRLVPSKTDDNASDLLTVQNVNEWLSSLRLEPVSANIVDIDISAEGFKQFDQYKVEYAAIDQPNEWKQVSNITRNDPHLTVDKLKAGVDYKFRLTPILRGSTTAMKDEISSQLSLVLDVKMPLTRKGRLMKNEIKSTAPPTQFAIHQTDPKTVFIEAILPSNKPALFEDVFDVYSKKDIVDDNWVKVGTIDKDHLSMTIKNLPENTAYTFKINNQSTPLSDEQNNVVQEFNFETASVKLYDPSLFLEKVEKTLENVVNGVMLAAAGHQTLEDPVNISLNDVIQKLFHDENLVPNEQYGFDTLALSEDLQLFHGPKQMMLQELTINDTSEFSKHDGEIIIHNYRKSNHEQQPVIVREEHGNTRIGNIDGDVIIRNVVTDVLLTNEEKRNQLSMNIVGQAFLKRVQGTLIASKFKGIIVVKNVDKP